MKRKYIEIYLKYVKIVMDMVGLKVKLISYKEI